MMAPLSLKSFSCIYFIRTFAYRQMKGPKHREKSRRERLRKPKQPTLGSSFFCLFDNLLRIDGTNNERMVTPGLDNVIFLHVPHPNMCL